MLRVRTRADKRQFSDRVGHGGLEKQKNEQIAVDGFLSVIRIVDSFSSVIRVIDGKIAADASEPAFFAGGCERLLHGRLSLGSLVGETEHDFAPQPARHRRPGLLLPLLALGEETRQLHAAQQTAARRDLAALHRLETALGDEWEEDCVEVVEDREEQTRRAHPLLVAILAAVVIAETQHLSSSGKHCS